LRPWANTLLNLLIVRRIRPSRMRESDFPFVSVLIPAGNEERRIVPCLTSLVEQNYPHYEILMLDDNSEDATRHCAEIVPKTRNKKIELPFVLLVAPQTGRATTVEEVLAIYELRMLYAARYRSSWLGAALHPIGLMFAMLIGLNGGAARPALPVRGGKAELTK
jgi:cellulose synthase/poly-beta-1,6-N-acetylglucosamine synthase-like glycosyltransferase